MAPTSSPATSLPTTSAAVATRRGPCACGSTRGRQPVSVASVCASRSWRSRTCVEVGLRRRRRRPVAFPRVAQHVARLEVRAVRGLLEHEVLGQRVARVAKVQPREHRPAARRRVRAVGRAPRRRPRARSSAARQRIRRAGVAPAHVPEVLGEHGAIAPRARPARRTSPCRCCAKSLAHVARELDVGRQLDRAVVGRLDAARLRQHVERPGPAGRRAFSMPRRTGSMNFGRLERELQRAQVRRAGLRLLLEVRPCATKNFMFCRM